MLYARPAVTYATHHSWIESNLRILEKRLKPGHWMGNSRSKLSILKIGEGQFKKPTFYSNEATL